MLCTATDASGNTSNCAFTVTVIDDQPPQINCPAGFNVNAAAGSCSAIVIYSAPSASDNCSVTSVTCSPPSGSTFPIGTNTVRCTATDESSITSTCTFTITVIDNQPPQINCPAAVNVNAVAGACSAVVSYSTPSAYDNCSVSSVTCSPPSGSIFPIGTTTVRCTATDAAGNSSICGLEVRVAQPVTISSNFNGTAISAGSTIWFNGVLKPQGLGANSLTIRVVGQRIIGSSFSLDVPESVIIFDPAATTATTTFVNGSWVTRASPSGLAGNVFMAGLRYQVLSNLPGGLNPVSWSGTFVSDRPDVTLQWKWAAAVYRNFGDNYTALGVKPIDDNQGSQYLNSDHAGTPENYKGYVVGGARGGGGSNYTGSYSSTQSVTPCVRGN